MTTRQIGIVVAVEARHLFLLREGRIERKYAVSTSRFGVWNREGSGRTPLRKHRIVEKVGTEVLIVESWEGQVHGKAQGPVPRHALIGAESRTMRK